MINGVRQNVSKQYGCQSAACMCGEFGGSEAKKEAGASSTRFSGTTGFGKGLMYQSCSVAKYVIDAVTQTVTRSNNNNIYFPGWKPW